ncbi:Na+/H+ antiporter subunit E [Pontibacter sp. E15-1]|uniref:Na+/H+ antiporter subunit E n=1 Tax=Pontibacter sp. E15-1 TaxID=2919918 RepID=UPI001F4F92DE|nr:Na+/H+ antiporter subunit E [Pontibacter sp. E15-1]MCJ8163656.1 Na+/H+ antiporter subunit E [Pontibacter sp. E15-1]
MIHCVLAFALVFMALREDHLAIPYNALSASLVFALVFTLLWMSTLFYRKSYFRKLPKALGLSLFFLKEMIYANLKIAYDILTPHYYMRPTVIALPLAVQTNLEIMLLANMISLTPGTLSLDVSKDRQTLYVHALYVKQNDVEKVKRHIKDGFERRLLELTT